MGSVEGLNAHMPQIRREKFEVAFTVGGGGTTDLNLFFLLDSRLGTGSVDGPGVFMEGVRGEHEHHNQQKNDEEEDKGWFAISLLQLVQPYAATCVSSTIISNTQPFA